jgi:hypothetical protein
MHVSLGRFAASLLALAALSGAASALPASLASVRAALGSVGAEKPRSAILYGQAHAAGAVAGLGFVAGLRRCAAMLQAANRFNLNRYGGTLTIDTAEDLGPVVCTVVLVFIDDDNSFGLDEACQWSQAQTDFRSFIMDEKINLRGFSLL